MIAQFLRHFICDVLCDFGSCGGSTSSAENVTLIDVKILMATFPNW